MILIYPTHELNGQATHAFQGYESVFAMIDFIHTLLVLSVTSERMNTEYWF